MTTVHNRFNRKVWAFASDFTGSLARCLVKQSPYTVPDNLSISVEKFHAEIVSCFDFDEIGMAEIDLSVLRGQLEPMLWKIPEIAALNDRKNGAEGNGFVSRYSKKPDPDNDFIDLAAVAGNIVCDFAQEKDAQCWLDQNRESIDPSDIPIIKADELETALSEPKKH